MRSLYILLFVSSIITLVLVGVVGCDSPKMTATEVCAYVGQVLPHEVCHEGLCYKKECADWSAEYIGGGQWEVYATVGRQGLTPSEILDSPTHARYRKGGNYVFPYEFNENTAEVSQILP